MNITLKQLRYFEALARMGHFGRAAEVCAISQPALSLQIKELEETLGCALFERGPRHVRLTSFGAMFKARAVEILRAVDELGDLARAVQTDLVGRLRIGIIPTIAPYLLPRFISDLTRLHPEIDVHVRETITPRLIEELEAGALDFAIVALPVGGTSLTEVSLFDEEMLLVRPDGAAALPVVDTAALKDERLLLLEEGHCFRDQALSACELPAGARREGLDGTSLSTLVQMVGAGIGVTLIPEMAVGVETRGVPVRVSAFAEPKPRRTVGMVWRKTSPLADRLLGIAGIARDAAADVGEERSSGQARG